MKRLVKKNIIIAIFILALINVTIGFLLLKSRSLSHLAIWRTMESEAKDDFYWQPEDAPGYFYFEPDSDRLTIFKNEISSLIESEKDEFKTVLKIAEYLTNITSDNIQQGVSLKWDSPEGMLRQIKEGAVANCFHRSILFSAYLSSLGIKSRLWALENEGFNATAHSINEVYIKTLKKWVFIDIMLGFYVTEKGGLLSLLELRERLLKGGDGTILVCNIRDEIEEQKKLPVFYKRLIKCVFLRSGNDFINKYNAKIRYGIFSVFQRRIDRFPDDIRRGLDYLLGRRDIFIHYVDSFSKSLGPRIIAAKLVFYFFILSLISMAVFLAAFCVVFLRRFFAMNLFRRDTRHR